MSYYAIFIPSAKFERGVNYTPEGGCDISWLPAEDRTNVQSGLDSSPWKTADTLNVGFSYSTDGGATWTDAGASAAGNGTDGSAAIDRHGNPGWLGSVASVLDGTDWTHIRLKVTVSRHGESTGIIILTND